MSFWDELAAANKERFLVEAGLAFSPLRTHALVTGIHEDRRVWSWLRFARTLQVLTAERLDAHGV